VVCSVGVSAAVFHAMPDFVSLIGMAVIMAAGLFSMSQHRPAPHVVATPVLDTLPDEPRKAA
jgi:hypothetical protein